MILVDTSVWVDHFRQPNDLLVRLLGEGRVLGHPFITGELALGNLRNREAILTALQDLPQVTPATDSEVLGLIGHDRLYGVGIGYVDVHLLAAIRLTPGSALWTGDISLRAAATQMGVAWGVDE